VISSIELTGVFGLVGGLVRTDGQEQFEFTIHNCGAAVQRLLDSDHGYEFDAAQNTAHPTGSEELMTVLGCYFLTPHYYHQQQQQQQQQQQVGGGAG
jgi:hypothetical protein